MARNTSLAETEVLVTNSEEDESKVPNPIYLVYHILVMKLYNLIWTSSNYIKKNRWHRNALCSGIANE